MAYNPFDQTSGTDPRGRIQNQSGYQQQRYESQINPVMDLMAENYARGSESNFGDYNNIMNQYNSIASGGGAVGGGSGGGDYSYGAEEWTPENIKYNDPFSSYAGYEDFSKTGGYSPQDINNMRARGAAPIRAAYGNAEREVARQRSLQGGYSPNAFALQGRMAREQGQLGADAAVNTEAQLAEARNKGRLAGLGGMSDIEKQRLAGDLDVQKYNATINNQAKQSNVGARNAAAAGSASNNAAAAAASRSDQLRALSGMTSLYGTTPGMAQLYGDQVLSAIGQSGTFGQNQVKNEIAGQQLPGKYEQTTARAKDWIDTASRIANPIVDKLTQPKKKQPIAPTTAPTPTYDARSQGAGPGPDGGWG
jgi:hypothetical protein